MKNTTKAVIALTAVAISGSLVSLQNHNASAASARVVQTNLALNKPSAMSSVNGRYLAKLGNDGITDGALAKGSVFQTKSESAWWDVDLGQMSAISSIKLWNRTDCCATRSDGIYILTSAVPFSGTLNQSLASGQVSKKLISRIVGTSATTNYLTPITARYVRVWLKSPNILHLAEVEVMGTQIIGATSTSASPNTLAVSTTTQSRTPTAFGTTSTALTTTSTSSSTSTALTTSPTSTTSTALVASTTFAPSAGVTTTSKTPSPTTSTVASSGSLGSNELLSSSFAPTGRLQVIYNDALVETQDWGWSPHNLASTSPVKSGKAIQLTAKSWGGLQLHLGQPFVPPKNSFLRFYVNSDTATGISNLTVGLTDDANKLTEVHIAPLLQNLTPNTWVPVQISLDKTGLAGKKIDLVSFTFPGDASGLLNIDNIEFNAGNSDIVSNSCSAVTKIMPLGDSTTAYPESYRGPLYRYLKTSGYGFDFVGSLYWEPAEGGDPDGEGHGGYTIGPDTNIQKDGTRANISDNVESWITKGDPDVILLSIGHNDYASGGAVAQTSAQSLKALVGKISRIKPSVKILVGTIAPDMYDLTGQNQYKPLNDMAKALGELSASDNVIYVPLNSRMLAAGFDHKVDTVDGTHLSLSGGKKFAEAWKQELLPLLQKCN